MLKLDPGKSPYDVHFRLLGIPVQIHPWFWIAAFALNYPASQGRADFLLLGMLAMFLSILVHEFGHALTMRYFGIPARVVLYHFGGLALSLRSEYEEFIPRKRSNWSNVLILFAGPGAGFLLATLLAVIIIATGGIFQLVPPDLQNKSLQFWKYQLAENWKNEHLYVLCHFLFFCNIYWGLMNLIPILPLDGGQIARELLSLEDAYTGLARALQLSCILGVVVGVLGFAILEMQYVGVMFLILAYSNYVSWQQLGRRFS